MQNFRYLQTTYYFAIDLSERTNLTLSYLNESFRQDIMVLMYDVRIRSNWSLSMLPGLILGRMPGEKPQQYVKALMRLSMISQWDSQFIVLLQEDISIGGRDA